MKALRTRSLHGLTTVSGVSLRRASLQADARILIDRGLTDDEISATLGVPVRTLRSWRLR